MLTPTLETVRVLLRPLTVADAETAYNAWTSDPEVARFMRYSTHASLKNTQEWLALEEQNTLTDTNYTWGFVLKETGALFGSGGINYSEPHGAFELGYNIARPYWGRGLTTEACRAILDFAAQTLGVREFFSCHSKDNPASGRVLEKLGFVYQKDGLYKSFDGTRTFDAREYSLSM